MLEIRHLDVRYDDVQVVWDANFSVARGEVVALIGANGAGKSTLLKAISGIVRPSAGEIIFNDRPIHGRKAYELVATGLAHVPEARRLFVDMTVEENLDLGSLKGEAKAKRKATREMVYCLFPRLRERRRQIAGTLSGGEQQMVAIGRGLMSLPSLIMFDEPSLGLAPILVREIFGVIRRIRSEGVTVLVVEQNVNQTLAVADRAYVLETGRIVLEGSGSELLGNEHVRKAYLGV